ncbi:MAG: NADH:ubiquinone oxidoreductase chain I-like protein [Solidesulfovibrio magneticus str. Maddingley MBC34]|uniref:NADH:ubiquinone oxidoreductase chain I-like protein n=1 Tax=Solidesulfovibrio magneticus str. Maddingley MBC34 TaxID=1206767 RepID=K6FK26_9BACT|nr:MAG: NADH:ubiquinone oxidoreductase chain I-like protein [Solidesulfovibrio magneticus str. Maddingley MBC34]
MLLSDLVREAATGLKSLFVGLGITGRAFAKPAVTVIYPKQEVTNLDTYRGHIELVGREDNPAMPRCIACGACTRACPSQCLSVGCPVGAGSGGDPETLELAGELIPVGTAMAPAPQKGCKVPGVFIYDYSLCSLCGQCVRACPVDSLRFSQHVYYVGTSRADFRLDLMARLARQAAEAPAPAPEAPRPADATPMEEHP